ncbi:MAG TPA: DUF4214 domain-containing protein [Pyrinomonadaceae bacterium]
MIGHTGSCVGATTRFVQNLYYGALRRDPTAQEMQAATNALAASGAQGEAQLLLKAKETARALFIQTAYETSPHRSDPQYVTDLYYAYLQRAPDTQGLDHWVGQLANGRDNVCNAFEASAEFEALVSTLYGDASSDGERRDRIIHVFHLGADGRIANSSELDNWRGQLDAAAAGPDEVKAKAELLGRGLFAAQVGDLSLPSGQFVTNLYESFLQRGPDADGLAHWTAQAGYTAQGRQHVLDAFVTCPRSVSWPAPSTARRSGWSATTWARRGWWPTGRGAWQESGGTTTCRSARSCRRTFLK